MIDKLCYRTEHANFSDLVGKILIEVIKTTHDDGDALKFVTSEGEAFWMYHERDCCESVNIEDITGDLNDLLESPILFAREDTNNDGDDFNTPPKYDGEESYTWTFYNIATANGHVTIRWYGCSNGYYSESVDIRKETSHSIPDGVYVETIEGLGQKAYIVSDGEITGRQG